VNLAMFLPGIKARDAHFSGKLKEYLFTEKPLAND